MDAGIIFGQPRCALGAAAPGQFLGKSAAAAKGLVSSSLRFQRLVGSARAPASSLRRAESVVDRAILLRPVGNATGPVGTGSNSEANVGRRGNYRRVTKTYKDVFGNKTTETRWVPETNVIAAVIGIVIGVWLLLSIFGF